MSPGASPPAPVFFDPTGRRRRAINRASLIAGIGTGVAGVLFTISLLAAPFVQQPGAGSQAAHLAHRTSGSLLASRRVRVSRHLAARARAALEQEIAASHNIPAPRGDTIVGAFYVVWQPNGFNELAVNASHLTTLFPEWMHLARDGASLDLRDWDPTVNTRNPDVVKLAYLHHLDILPILNNAESRQFDPQRAALMLRSPVRRRAVAHRVREFLMANGFDGVNVDFEQLDSADYARLPAFLAELKAALPDTLRVSVDIEASLPTPMIARLARIADFVVLMTYAENGPGTAPGPLAALPWFDSLLTRVRPAVPPGKLVVGIGNYGVDWTRGGSAGPITVQDAWVRAHNQRPDDPPEKVVDFDDVSLNPTFVYQGDSTDQHEVWFLDAATAYDELRLTQRHGAAGSALWVLGAEDPSLWTLYDRRNTEGPVAPARLDTIRAPGGITYTGRGEMLTVAARPRDGLRSTDVDSSTGLISDETYHTYPSSFVVHRSGYRPRLLALTFDDGPDDKWTSAILDTLDALDVHATFFLVGQNVEKYPDVVRRMVADGDDIGNHTYTHPNMAVVGRRRGALELNAAQRAIEAVTGRSTTLFRVPYNVDAEPQYDEEAGPLEVASSLGYVTVGEQIDPNDWNLVVTEPDGTHRPRTVQEIVDSTIAQVHAGVGNVILLHSAGGDRSRTVKALPQIVRLLQDEGYRFVTISELLGEPRDVVMPPVQARDLVLVGFDRVTFEIMDLAETLLTWGFLAAVALALARLAIVVPLAVKSARVLAHASYDEAYRPPVSVLVPAYNEAPVIARTVAAALASEWPALEVIVVDDGSADGTAGVVEQSFAGDPRVRVLRQANAGKAAALNTAIAQARHEVLVAFDADTQVEPGAIALLARHFADPMVGAVAGNVKVGNRINALTVWQSIEYITSQNLDRRAYSLLNAVTVVPGAIGAWRRAAVHDVGGFVTDTLAEDMDLTFRLRRAGWRITADMDAVAWTEAPERFGPFLRQRFRWAYGSLQVLWKHRAALGRYGAFGRLALPAQWLFGVIFQALGPLVDLRLLYAMLSVAASAVLGSALHQDFQPLLQLERILVQTGFFYGLFFCVDFATSLVALRLDREDGRQLWWLFWQRFVYRQTMYYVLWKAVVGAAKGKRHGWGKIQRTGSVVRQEHREAVLTG